MGIVLDTLVDDISLVVVLDLFAKVFLLRSSSNCVDYYLHFAMMLGRFETFFEFFWAGDVSFDDFFERDLFLFECLDEFLL